MDITPSQDIDFEYEPLPPGHIRLISLWGIPLNAFPETIHCRFEVHHVDSLPKYDAISYAWGSEPPTKTIDCLSSVNKRGAICITPHLWRGLAMIMYKAPSLLCWLDFLCINQNDIEEKERQIRLMTEIYGRAVNVVIWLGEPEHAWELECMTREVLTFVMVLLKMQPPGESIRGTGWSEPSWQAIAQALRRMYSLPWFYRSWVCQEAILAEKIVLLYGCNLIPWDLLCELRATTEQTWFDLIMGKDVIRDNDPEKACRDSLLSINELRTYLRTRASIRTDRLIHLIRSRAVSTLADKVYCLLGLLDPEIANEITVDYSKSYEQVYLEFAKAVITRDKSLSLIATASVPQMLTTSTPLPSWCPDLSRGIPETFSFLDFEYFAGFENASLQTNRVTLLPRGFHVSVPGFRLGIVREVAPLRPDIGVVTEAELPDRLISTIDDQRPWYDTVHDLIRRALEPHAWSEAEIKEATWRVHIAGVANAYLTPDPDDAEAFLADYGEAFYPACELMGEGFEIWLKCIRNVNPAYLVTGDANAGVTFDRFFADEKIGTREIRLCVLWLKEFIGFGRRRIFSTENGLIGMGPMDVQVGDLACVLYDASPIIILRNMLGTGDAEGRECFQSVGDGYVYGCMELAKTPMEFRNQEECFIIG